MSDRDNFKNILNTRGGSFFKFYENGSFLRYGFKDKYFFECKIHRNEVRRCQSIIGNPQKFIIVYINSFNYVEGRIPFDATVNTVDGEMNSYLVYILEHRIQIKEFEDLKIEDLKNKYLEQIIQHEMNHYRTTDLLSNFKDENNKFVSEILADTLLIFENSENEDFINIKIKDI